MDWLELMRVKGTSTNFTKDARSKRRGVKEVNKTRDNWRDRQRDIATEEWKIENKI